MRPSSGRASRSTGSRPRAGRPSPGGGAVPGAHEAGTARPERRPAVGRARPGGVRPGAHPRGRLRHPVPARPSVAPPCCGPVLRVAWRGRAGRGARVALPRGVSRGAGRSRQPAAGGAGEDRPPGGRIACELARQPRPGGALPRRGDRSHRRPRRDRGAPRAGGERAVLGGDVGQAEPLLRDAITRREEMGDRSGAARDGAARAGIYQRLACGGCDCHPRTGSRSVRRSSPTIPRSRRSSTSSRAGTGSATTRSGRSTSPTAQSGARSGSKPSS